MEDGFRLKSTVQGGEHKAIAIVGGGFIGLEMAEELTNSGLEVHLFEVMPRCCPSLKSGFPLPCWTCCKSTGCMCT